MTDTSETTKVDKYIASQAESIQPVLNEIRLTIRAAAPESTESISYAMPTYKLKGKPVIYFGAFLNHVGLYATPAGHAKFETELSKYKRGKGSVRLPLGQPIPHDLIRRIVQYRVRAIMKGDA